MLRRIILSHLSRRSTPVHPLLATAREQMKALWARSTWNDRARLLQRLQQFSDQHRIRSWPIGAQAVAFISSIKSALPSTLLSYSKTLAAVARRFGHQVPMLDVYAASLRASGANVPTTQATPALRQQVLFLLAKASNDPRLASCLYIAWKTASRWDDLRSLTRSSVVQHGPTRLILRWGATKSTRSDPFRNSTWVVIDELDPSLQSMLHRATRTLLELPQDQSLLQWTTTRLTAWMRTFPQTANLSGHSFKRGALRLLVLAVLDGRLADKRLIALLAKHKDALNEMPSTTLRYVSDQASLALMLRTQDVTRLL